MWSLYVALNVVFYHSSYHSMEIPDIVPERLRRWLFGQETSAREGEALRGRGAGPLQHEAWDMSIHRKRPGKRGRLGMLNLTIIICWDCGERYGVCISVSGLTCCS